MIPKYKLPLLKWWNHLKYYVFPSLLSILHYAINLIAYAQITELRTWNCNI